jgi:hypothetical protein
MSRSPDRMQRLVRLRQFREEIAEGVQRTAAAAVREAEQVHEQALAAAEAIGAWKVRAGAESIDLGFYQAAIAAEAVAMENATQRERELDDASGASTRAIEALRDAALGHRVARHRHERLQAEAAIAEERREFDQLSDLTAASRGDTR